MLAECTDLDDLPFDADSKELFVKRQELKLLIERILEVSPDPNITYNLQMILVNFENIEFVLAIDAIAGMLLTNNELAQIILDEVDVMKRLDTVLAYAHGSLDLLKYQRDLERNITATESVPDPSANRQRRKLAP